MATPREIQAQVELERTSITTGLSRLHATVKKLEDQNYASATPYGASAVAAAIPLVSARIDETRERIHKGQAGRDHADILEFMNRLPSDVSATIVLKITFDQVFSTRDRSDHLQEVAVAIGNAIEQECMMRHYHDEAPGLMRYIQEKYWHDSCGTQQKARLTKTLFNRSDAEPWQTWPVTMRVRIGTWLLDCVMISTGWFTKHLKRKNRKTYNIILPTEEFAHLKDSIMHDAEMMSPIAYPMLIPPNDWSHDHKGGYLLNELMRSHSLIRKRAPSYPDLRLSDTCYNFLNKIQKVGYRVNRFVYDVAEFLAERGIEVGKFKPVVTMPLPNKPADIETNEEARKEYRRQAAEVMNFNSGAFKRSCRTRRTMETARQFLNVEKFYLPWSFDYRGRAYPIPAFLTPQDTDFGKSLLLFADSDYLVPEAEEWLAFQVATTYGLDKATIRDRMEWVQQNLDLIEAVATEPIDNLGLWEGADEPWQFLAACEEYYYCIIKATRNFTSLPIATDATCSGLQILAGLARDKSTAQLVNVLPGDKPSDAYKVVAETAMPNCPESVQPYMDRKTVKRVVMTVPYNAKPFSNRQYIAEALAERGVKVDNDDLTATVRAVRSAMDKVVPGPMAVMKWIEKEVASIFNDGATHLQWTTPSGFVVHQLLNKIDFVTIELNLLGRTKVRVGLDVGPEVNKRHHRNATAPNLIHSLDASLLHLAVEQFNSPIALIHDSVLCRATDMAHLSTVVRETYMHLFAENSYLEDWAEQVGAKTKPPIIGDLQPETVIDSTYFFS